MSQRIKPKPKKKPAPSGLFTPSERLIYRYWNGSRQVAVDPVAVSRKLARIDDFNIDRDIQIAASGIPDAVVSLGRLVSAARDVFDLEPFAEDDRGRPVGLTETQTVELLANFLTWLGEAQSDADPLPASPVPTAPAVSRVEPSPTASS